MTNPGEDDSAYERQGDARRKFWIKPLQEIDPGVAQAFLTPERLCCYFYIFQHATLNKTFTAKYNAILPRTPWDQNPRFTPQPKQDDEHRKPFYMRSAPTPPEWRTLVLYSPPHFVSYLQTSETQRYQERSSYL